MKLTNSWVGYLDRTAAQIKVSLITKLKLKVPEVTDLSETNLLVIIIAMFSGLVEQIHFYVDNLARESFLSTARKFSSVVKLVRILDYRIKARLPASVDLYLTYRNGGGVVVLTQQGVIPAGTVIRTSNGIPFTTTKTVVVEPGKSFAKLTAKQWERVTGRILGSTTVAKNQRFILPDNYAHNSIELYINGEPWILQTTLARSGPIDKHFVVNIDEVGMPTIQLGNGINGAIPIGNVDAIGDFYITEGSMGNEISKNTINQLESVLVVPTPATGLTITNDLSPVAGSEVESLEDVRVNAPLSIRTLDRAVTPNDYQDILNQASGIAKAAVTYEGGLYINVYISPNGGGIATDSLLQDTADYLDEVRMIGKKPIVKAAGITPVVANLEILPKFRVDKVQVKLDVEAELTRLFSFEMQKINGRVAWSDITAAIDNLDRVDTVEILGLYTLPYPHKTKGNNTLNWERQTLITSNETATWRLSYSGTNFRLYYNSSYIANININQVYTDPKGLISLKILPGNYSISDAWQFKTYPANKTLKLDDNTVPIIIGGQTTTINVL